MKALTVWQPWCWAIFDIPAGLAKDVENRTWSAPHVVGKFIAIHAAKKVDDKEAWFSVQRISGYHPPTINATGDAGVPELPQSCIVGVAEITGMVAQSESPWFVGPVGWVIGRRIRFLEPIPCGGAQGLWEVPRDLEGLVRKAIEDARTAARRPQRVTERSA